MRSLPEVKQIVEHMLGIRNPREAEWQELARWIGGQHGLFESQSEEDDLTLFRSIACQALQRSASGMTSGMTPRNISWFKPAFEERPLEEASGAREWLDLLDNRMKDVLALGSFYQAIHQLNTDLLWAGCALIYAEKSDATLMRFECQQIGSFCIALDSEKRLQAVARLLRLSPQTIIKLFGRNLEQDSQGQAIRDLNKNAPYGDKLVWQYVERTDKKKGKPISSYYWLDGSEHFLKTGGYYEMPFFFAVWRPGPTPYGLGPGDDVLADVRQIDKMERMKLAGLAKLVDPPVAVPYGLKDSLNLTPGGINYIAGQELIRPIIDLAPYSQSLQHLQLEIDKVGQRVEKGLMSTIFDSMPLESRPKNMSATEFLERKREAMQMLGPVISAYEPTVLSPLLFRLAQTLDRAGLTPPLPPDLANIPVFMKMEFLSPVANALRQSGAEATRALWQDVAAMVQATQRQEIFDKLDLDQTVDELAKGIGAPGSIIRSDDDVSRIRQQRDAQTREREQADAAMRQLAMTESAQKVAANQLALTGDGNAAI